MSSTGQASLARSNSRLRAGTVAVSSNIDSAAAGASTFYVVISPPHLLSRNKPRLKLKSDNIQEDGSSLLQSKQHHSASLPGNVAVRNSGDNAELSKNVNDNGKRESVDDYLGEPDDVFAEEQEVKAQLDIMNEAMANVNSLTKMTDETIAVHRSTLGNAEKHLAKLARGISKKDIELAAPYFRLYRVNKMTEREVSKLNQDLKTAESLWTMAEDAVSQLKFNLASAPDVYASEACAEVRRHAEGESAKWKSETETLLKKLIEKQDALSALNKQMAAEFQHRKRVVKKTSPFYEYKIEIETRLEELATEVTKQRSQLETAKSRYKEALKQLEELSNAIHIKRTSVDSVSTTQNMSSNNLELLSSDVLSTSLNIVASGSESAGAGTEHADAAEENDDDGVVNISLEREGDQIVPAEVKSSHSVVSDGSDSVRATMVEPRSEPQFDDAVVPIESLSVSSIEPEPATLKSEELENVDVLSTPLAVSSKVEPLEDDEPVVPMETLSLSTENEAEPENNQQQQQQQEQSEERMVVSEPLSTPRAPVLRLSHPLNPVDLVDALSDEEAV